MLDDLRVVELSATSAAAFAGRFCADAGAEVILVEPPSGHPLRYEGPFRDDVPNPETSALLPPGDGFLPALPLAVLDPLDLRWEVLREANRALVMTQITPFGNTGPYR